MKYAQKSYLRNFFFRDHVLNSFLSKPFATSKSYHLLLPTIRDHVTRILARLEFWRPACRHDSALTGLEGDELARQVLNGLYKSDPTTTRFGAKSISMGVHGECSRRYAADIQLGELLVYSFEIADPFFSLSQMSNIALPTPPHTMNTPASNGPGGGFFGFIQPNSHSWASAPTASGVHSGPSGPYHNVQDLSTTASSLPRWISDVTHEVLMRAGNIAHVELYKKSAALEVQLKALQ